MKRISILTLILTITFSTMAQQSIYNISVKDNKGNETSLSIYKGKVLLIVNTATECGFTPQYDDLDELYAQYRDKGFEILEFPCNQFGGQAPGTDEEIQQFCTMRFHTEFPRFKKIDVNGENESPLYTYLKSQKSFAGFDPNHKLGPVLDNMLRKADPDYDKKSDIKWNFTKFLVDQEGNVVQRFEPTADKTVLAPAIEALLK